MFFDIIYMFKTECRHFKQLQRWQQKIMRTDQNRNTEEEKVASESSYCRNGIFGK